MIYGKITLEDWRTACVEGEEPESSFESYNLRLFFFGTLYNRDTLQATPDVYQCQACCRCVSIRSGIWLFTSGRFVHHSILFRKMNAEWCATIMARIIPSIVTLMVICHFLAILEDQLEENFEPNLVSLSTFLQRGILKKNNSPYSMFIL